jgi:hypothetical protein
LKNVKITNLIFVIEPRRGKPYTEEQKI